MDENKVSFNNRRRRIKKDPAQVKGKRCIKKKKNEGVGSDEMIKHAIIKASDIIRKKQRALKIGKIEKDNFNMETLQPVVKPLQDMIHSTKLIPNVDVKNEKHILAELEDNSSIDGNHDKKSEKNDDAMSIEDPDSIAQAIRERSFRYQPYLRDQKKRKLVDTSFLKSPRGHWVNEKSPKSNLDGSTQSKFFDLSHNTAEIAQSSSSYPYSQEKSNQNQDATTTTTATGVSSKKTEMFDSLNGAGDKKNIMMKARLLIQTIMNVAFFKSGYKNPLALPIEEAMTQRAAMEFVSDHNEQESRLIGKIGQMIHLSMSSMESYFTSKFREVEVYTVKISEDMFRFKDEFHRLRGLLSARIEEMDALLKKVREEEQENRVDRDKLNRMEVSHVITRENFANIVRLLEEHNSDSMKNFKSIDERFSTLNDSCQEFQNRYDNLTRNVEEIKEDLLNTRSKLEKEYDSSVVTTVSRIYDVNVKLDNLNKRFDKEIINLEITYQDMRAFLDDLMVEIQNIRREANTERLETDELNEKLGNFPEHILGNEGGEVQDISKDEEVDKKKILLEENVEVDEDKFKKLEERMYNE
ncbi:hypothetical protein QAD02_018640 [Eretmocerus hayati]|uniref:Uncharacterized protein n=1 Tax=Eretmocerus hayati TaxID=131215 RepID=A0ACC2PID8_9HYME|nr:hypothetical protein QAD02_018640 [Eretmocerus hayati]